MPHEETARTCLTLRSTQFQALRDLSIRTGAPMAELTRRALDAFLAGHILSYVPGAPQAQSAPAPSTSHS
jgi:Ribbon-helix-helix domain